jgi:hypothetical protein
MRNWIRVGLIVFAAVGAIAVGVTLLSSGSGSGQLQRPNAEVRACEERIEGGHLASNPRQDSVVGPVTFTGLRSAYRDALRGERLDGPPVSPIKVITLVRSGPAVTLEVPKAERPWLQLNYLFPLDRTEAAATLRPCVQAPSVRAQRRECHWSPFGACRSGVTQFNGGFSVRFAHAPAAGRCAALRVWVEERPNPITAYPFTRASCE